MYTTLQLPAKGIFFKGSDATHVQQLPVAQRHGIFAIPQMGMKLVLVAQPPLRIHFSVP
jgi:hypothetical protein